MTDLNKRLDDYIEYATAVRRFSDVHFYEQIKSELDRLRRQVPEGWKSVPMHADESMVRIGVRAHNEEILYRQDPAANIQGIWKAMVHHAPDSGGEE